MDLALLIFLILLNGIFAMSEMALASSRKARLQVLVEARPAQTAGHVTGTACRYVSVEFPGGRSLLGQLCNVTVTEVRDGLVLAKQTESHP